MESLKIIMAACAILMGFGIASCNTVEGVGDDIESVGDKMSDSAD